MKKNIIVIALVFVMAFSTIGFTACNDGNPDYTNSGSTGNWSDWNDWEDWDAGFADSYTEFIPSFDYYSGMKVEAEDTKHSDCNVSDGGSGQILDWTNDNTTLKFSLAVEEQTTVELLVKVAVDFSDYRSRNIADRLALTLNGEQVTLSGQFTQNYEGDWWQSYFLVSVGEITLTSGDISVELKLSDSLNIDYLKFGNTFNFTGNGFIVEAEDTDSTDCNVSSGGSGKVLDWTSNNTKVKFNVMAKEQTTVEMYVMVAVDFADNRSYNIADRLALTLNGEKVSLSGQFTHGYGEDDWWTVYVLVSLGNITLSEGINTFELKLSDSLNLDYIQFGIGG